jgi:hypothetical protein
MSQDWIDPRRNMLITPEEMNNFGNKPSPAPPTSPPPHQCEYFFLIDNIDPGQYEDSEDQNDAVEEKKK